MHDEVQALGIARKQDTQGIRNSEKHITEVRTQQLQQQGGSKLRASYIAIGTNKLSEKRPVTEEKKKTSQGWIRAAGGGRGGEEGGGYFPYLQG